jgi:AmmeMemoRadiSam system protein A
MPWRKRSRPPSRPGSSPRPAKRETESRHENWDESFDPLLLEIAHGSIESGLRHKRPLAVDCSEFAAELQLVRATFASLHLEGQLRGCIGTLEADLPLVVSVAENAFKAAFDDPRFPPLERHELPGIEIDISILTPLEAVEIHSEEDLVAKLRPGIDGLLLRDGSSQGTFLPAVWDGLPEPRQFVRELKRKAGLPLDYWSSTLEVWRYTTRSIP